MVDSFYRSFSFILRLKILLFSIFALITLIVLPYSVRPDKQDEEEIEMTISEFVSSFFKMNWVIAALFFLTSNILMSIVIFLTNGFSIFGEYRYTTMQLVNFAYALAFLGVFIKSAIELSDIVKVPDLTGENGLGLFPCFYMTVVCGFILIVLHFWDCGLNVYYIRNEPVNESYFITRF